ncbi:alpha/beta fold hydrolase [Leifsonia sp. F6_8S_P_1B]|uniref:Alpha/beta fold hydrolase n=1 Tax=Leifsonia williamsii TaxID=3035919 RepID=A0ABT8KB77_9MICO|nr:alpha/beta fold hydrolase [Leifsonia williamsii]MDN4613604.1 alpha/beta fold hydrolase [Leifsonia williamsii]
MRAFLLLHGWDNFRPAGHWQRELATALTGDGARVVYPQLPDASSPTVEAWREAAAAAFEEAAADGAPVTVICHSLGCLLWLGARPADEGAVERVLLVAPPSQDVVAGIAEIAPFAGLAVTRPAGEVAIVASDADPYCPEGAEAAYGAPLGIPVTTIPGGGHLDLAAGYGDWPSVLAWARDETTAIVPR